MKYINPVNYRRNFFSGSSLRDIEKELNALFGQLGAPSHSQTKSSGEIAWYENDDAFVARLDLPGVKSEDLSLEVDSGVLDVKAKRSDLGGSEESKESGRYAFRLKLPENVNEAQIGAKLENGVLSLTFPKQEKAKPRRIEVQQSN